MRTTGVTPISGMASSPGAAISTVRASARSLSRSTPSATGSNSFICRLPAGVPCVLRPARITCIAVDMARRQAYRKK